MTRPPSVYAAPHGIPGAHSALHPAGRALGKATGWLLRGLVIGYQWTLSPVLGANCRYLPSCSAYAIEALERHGPLTGAWLALRRLLRCNPWAGSGYDPVPDSRDAGQAGQTEPNHALGLAPSHAHLHCQAPAPCRAQGHEHEPAGPLDRQHHPAARSAAPKDSAAPLGAR